MILTQISLRFLENIVEFRTKSQNSCFKTRDFEYGFSPGFPRGIPQKLKIVVWHQYWGIPNSQIRESRAWSTGVSAKNREGGQIRPPFTVNTPTPKYHRPMPI